MSTARHPTAGQGWRLRHMRALPQDGRAWLLAALGAVALLLCLLFGVAAPAQAWAGYLAAYLFWLGLALGALALAMVHALTGGGWGELLRPQWLAALWTLPLLALALLPLLLGMHGLFPWLRAGAEPGAQFARQAWYLNAPFLLARAVIFMLLWLLLGLGLVRHLEHDAMPAPTSARRAARPLAVIGLVIYFVSASLFGFDWVAALAPRWHSSVFGLSFISLQLLGGFAAAVWALLGGPMGERLRTASSDTGLAQLLGNLGALLMVVLLASAYLFYMDYITAWSGDLPAETAWYIPRTLTSWRWLAAGVIVLGLVLPLALLLSRRIRRSVAGLRWVAMLLLLANAGALAWLVLPSLRPAGLWLHAGDALAFVGLGALWWSVYASALRRRPLAGAAP